MISTTIPIAFAVAALFLLALGAVADDRRARARRRAAAEPELEPPLLHSINDDRCIGCEACVDVCPTEVLDLVDHKVRVARFSDCVQCEQCANACPTTALVMYRQGSVPRTLTVPELDDHFQTGVPGQYLIGEVAGKPLVKNAANLGRAVIEHIARDLATQPAAGAGIVDVAIVGSGPGGLSAGLTCIKTGLSCIVLEKEHVLSSTVARYPKGKHFMAEPSTAINLSYLPVFDASKEELVAAWKRVVDGVQLPVKLGEAVESVKRGDDGVFTIKTTVATYRARTVVLATGLRGKPRLLAVPGANLEKVQSLLDDPAEFAGAHVLVVGGGDSAVEGAMSLADVGATVTLSYRGDGFKRCKQGNQKRLAEMTTAGKVSVLLESNVKEFTQDAVTIKLKDGSATTIPNTNAFVLIGADTPVAWLEANNVRFVEREHLYALGSTEDAVRKVVPDASECPRTAEEALARLHGRQPRLRTAPGRLRSVVEHLQHEFHDVVTSVSTMFSLSELDAKAPRASGRRYVTPVPRRATTPPVGSPAAKLPRARTAPVAPPKLFAAPRAPTGQVRALEHRALDRSSSKRPDPAANTTSETLSLPARMAALALDTQPSELDNTVVDAHDRTTIETPALRTDVRREQAPARSPRKPTPPRPPQSDPPKYKAAAERDAGAGLAVHRPPRAGTVRVPPPIPAPPARDPRPARIRLANGSVPPHRKDED